MMQVAEQEVLVDEIINFNGPEDDADVFMMTTSN